MQLGISIDSVPNMQYIASQMKGPQLRHDAASRIDFAIGSKMSVVDEAGCNLGALSQPIVVKGIFVYLADLLDFGTSLAASEGSSFEFGPCNGLPLHDCNYIQPGSHSKIFFCKQCK